MKSSVENKRIEHSAHHHCKFCIICFIITVDPSQTSHARWIGFMQIN